MNSMNQGATPSDLAVPCGSTRPTVSVCAPASRRAALSGTQPSSSATVSTRSRVASETPGRPFNAYDTAPIDTPAWAAMSLIVSRGACAVSVGARGGALHRSPARLPGPTRARW